MLYLLEALHCKNSKVEDSRIFGVFTEDKLDELRNIIINNISDLWEFYYRYLAIVKIPDNVLYVDCYTKLFELYEVSLPQEYLDAIKAKKTPQECDEVIKGRFDEIKFNLVNSTEIPEYISKYLNIIDMEEEEE